MEALTNQLSRVRRALSNLNDETTQTRFERGYYMRNYAEGYKIMKEIVNTRYEPKAGRPRLINQLTRLQETLQTNLNTAIASSRIPIAKEAMNLFPKIPQNVFSSVEQVRQRYDANRLFKKEQFTMFTDNEQYNRVPIADIREFTIRANDGENSIDAFKNLQKQLLRKYGNARLILEIFDFMVANKPLGKRGTTVNDMIDKLYTMYQELLKLSEDYEGGLEDLTYKEFLAGRIHISIPRPAGGCGNNHKSNEKFKGIDVIRREAYGCMLISKRTKNNNCGLECLRLLSNLPSCHNLRKEFNLPAGTKISFTDMYRIIDKYKLNIQIVDATMREVRGNEWKVCDTIVLSNEHYEILLRKVEQVIKQKCKICGKKYVNVHNCNEERAVFYNYKVLRKSGIVKNLYVDLETRNDTENIYSIVGNKYNPQVATLLAFSCENEVHSYLGLDCINRFCDFLIEEQDNLRYYNIFAHNGSRFDFFFFIHIMMSNPNYSKYIQTKNDIFKGSRIVSFHFGGHKFIDTMSFMNGSLSRLCIDFNVENSKKKEFTVGDKVMSSMDICLYDPSLTPTEYINYLHSCPEMKYAYIEYCRYDCISLQELHGKFVKEMNIIVEAVYSSAGKPRNDKISLYDATTLPGFFFKIWKDVECEENEYIPSPEEREFFNKAIIGGISHVHKKGKFTFTKENPGCVIDVVSLYVSQMIQQEYPYGAPRFVERGYDEGTLGIYRVENIVFPKSSLYQIKDIPNKTEKGLDWETEYIAEAYLTTTDLFRMAENGVEYDMKEGYVWDKTHNPFQMLDAITKIKMTQDILKDQGLKYNTALRNCCKLAGNSLYGKMMERSKNYTHHNFSSVYDIDEKMFELAKNITFSNNQFVIKEESDSSKSPLHLGVFVLGYARNCIMTYADMVGRDNIFTMETDSISCRMNDITKVIQGNGIYKVGNHLGGMDIELNNVSEGIFCAKKCYALKYEKKEQSSYKMRFKGVPSSLLNYNLYERLIEHGTLDISGIAVWKRDLFNTDNSGISIGIQTKQIVL